MTYDPKRNRQGPAVSDDAPAPVDAILGGGDIVDLRDPTEVPSPAPGPDPAPPAPHEVTGGNGPKLMLVVAGIAGATSVLLYLLRRRRRS